LRSDVELLSAWRGGEKGAGNELVRRHFSQVYRFFRSKIDEGVDDMTQQTFMALVENQDRMEDDAKFKAYLFGIARRQLLMRFRKSYRRARAIGFERTSIHHLAAESRNSPSRVVGEASERRLLLQALRSIPVDFQIVVELYYWERMSVADIARVVEVAPGTVKSRLYRARAMLEERLAQGLTPEKTATNEQLDDLITSLSDVLAKRDVEP
jgi:RNA polymerase sigma-70 factor (ECF subfamily)